MFKTFLDISDLTAAGEKALFRQATGPLQTRACAETEEKISAKRKNFIKQYLLNKNR
jgi:hypothetical protein